MTICEFSSITNATHDNWFGAGCCPHCGYGDGYTSIDSYLEDDCYVYECVCDNCGCEFKDVYSLSYHSVAWNKPEEEAQQQGGSVSPDPLGEIVADTMAAIHQIGEEARNQIGRAHV